MKTSWIVFRRSRSLLGGRADHVVCDRALATSFHLVHQCVRGRNGCLGGDRWIHKSNNSNAARYGPRARSESLLYSGAHLCNDLLRSATVGIG